MCSEWADNFGGNIDWLGKHWIQSEALSSLELSVLFYINMNKYSWKDKYVDGLVYFNDIYTDIYISMDHCLNNTGNM